MKEEGKQTRSHSLKQVRTDDTLIQKRELFIPTA